MTKYKQKDKVEIKGKVQIKKYKTKTYHQGTGNRHEEMQIKTYKDWTKTGGKAET